MSIQTMNGHLVRNLSWIGICFAMTATTVRAEDNRWQFTLSPYAWLPSLNADLRVGDVSASADVPIDETLKHSLDLAGMLNLEARRDRWGILVDGVYLDISPESETPGPFFNMIETTLEMAMLDVAVAYRVLETERGWLDVLVGARYVDISANLDMTPDYEAVDAISSSLVERTVAAVRESVEHNVARSAGEIADELADLVEDVGGAARDRVLEEGLSRIDEKIEGIVDGIEQIPPRVRSELKNTIYDRLADISDAHRVAIADAVKWSIDMNINRIKHDASAIGEEIRIAAERTLHDLKATASAEVRKALDDAESQLAGAIEEAMTKAAETDVKGDTAWVDPYFGGRGRLGLSESVYIGGRADVGGFGIGSELTWQVFAGIGVHLNDKADIEAGWRHLSIDYQEKDFTMDLSLSGAVIGARFNF